MRFLGTLIVMLLLGVGGYYAYDTLYKEPATRHIHAGFVVFVDGKQIDFSNIRYMSLVPCADHAGRKTHEEITQEKAHLHDNVGFVAHSHREGAVWADLFNNMNYTFDKTKTITGYVNGEQVDDIFEYPVNAYDSVVIVVGKTDPKFLTKGIIKDQIVKVEENSLDCGT